MLPKQLLGCRGFCEGMSPALMHLTAGDYIIARGVRCHVDYVSEEGYHLSHVSEPKNYFATIPYQEICVILRDEVRNITKYLESDEAKKEGQKDFEQLVANSTKVVKNDTKSKESDVFEEVTMHAIFESTNEEKK